jgi:NAD(P)-dependent dehydrogenase (short-subunit alcohol dehydrogenase family)
MEINLSNRTYLVTGVTSGIGRATAERLVQMGAYVIGVGRSAERCKQVRIQLSRLNPQAQVDLLLADLSERKEVKQLADQVSELIGSRDKTALDGLVNNAGVFTYWLTLTPEGFEMQWAVNHLAPFMLTQRLLPLLQAAPSARVVTVSSGSHYGAKIDWDDPQLRRHYNGLRAYGNTKLANILFTMELNRRLGNHSNVRAFAADPGLVRTDIGMKGTPAIAGLAWKLRRSGGIPPQEAANGIVFLLTEPSIQGSAEIYWKDSRPKRASRHAQDERAASRLWKLSERMCGIKKEVQYGTF